jgi:hypothetical protein
MYLNVLIKDNFEIQRYYHLQEAEIPIQKTDDTLTILPKFIELLLNLRVCIYLSIKFISLFILIVYYINIFNDILFIEYFNC